MIFYFLFILSDTELVQESVRLAFKDFGFTYATKSAFYVIAFSQSITHFSKKGIISKPKLISAEKDTFMIEDD